MNQRVLLKYASRIKQANPAATTTAPDPDAVGILGGGGGAPAAEIAKVNKFNRLTSAGLPAMSTPEDAFVEGVATINRTRAINTAKQLMGYGLAGGAAIGGIAGLANIMARPRKSVDPMTAGALAVDMPVPVAVYKKKKEKKKPESSGRQKRANENKKPGLFDSISDGINSVVSGASSATSDAYHSLKNNLTQARQNLTNDVDKGVKEIKSQIGDNGVTADLKQLGLPDQDVAAEGDGVPKDNFISRAIRGVGFSSPGAIPWAYPAAAAGLATTSLGTFYLLNKLMKSQRRQESKAELEHEQAEYKKRLKEMQHRRMERFKKQSSVRTSVDLLHSLNRLSESIQDLAEKTGTDVEALVKQAEHDLDHLLRFHQLSHRTPVSSHQERAKATQIEKSALWGFDVGDTAGSAAGAYGLLALGLGVPAAYMGYRHGKKNSTGEALEEAAKMRQQKRYAQQTPELFLNQNPTPVTIELDPDEYEEYKREQRRKKKLQKLL